MKKLIIFMVTLFVIGAAICVRENVSEAKETKTDKEYSTTYSELFDVDSSDHLIVFIEDLEMDAKGNYNYEIDSFRNVSFSKKWMENYKEKTGNNYVIIELN